MMLDVRLEVPERLGDLHPLVDLSLDVERPRSLLALQQATLSAGAHYVPTAIRRYEPTGRPMSRLACLLCTVAQSSTPATRPTIKSGASTIRTGMICATASSATAVRAASTARPNPNAPPIESFGGPLDPMRASVVAT
jgi:hypothetical protein